MVGVENAVVLNAVSHDYGKTKALDTVSLSIPRGATVGLIGPDGVGKSTLLSLIAGVRVIQQGLVQVLGGDMTHAKTRQALSHHIAYMPQGLGRNLYPTLSVYENIEFHARMFGLSAQERRARMDWLLHATGLAPFMQRAAGKLSGGMKQKLSLCCALVHSPDLLILDEPTTGVDPLSRRQFWALVRDLRQQIPDMTVIVATAYIDEAEQFEHLLAMDDGKLLVNRPTRQVMQELNAATLEEAYIKLLPADKQLGSGGLEMTPFIVDPHSPPAIEAHGLTKRFGDFVAVDHVRFTIQKGEIFGFLGSNGCGKSTTMKMLTGLLDASEGSAELLGQPIDASNRETRMKVGYMSQAFSLYEELTVRQNLDLHAQLYQMGVNGKAAVVQALKQFDLAHVADSKPAALPLGIRQRLQLAAACLHQPEVLILDEPTSGVDPAARDMFWRYLLKLSRQERITIFVSTHFMNEVERCDRISLMHRGRVLAVGTPAELVAQSQAANMEEAFIHYLEQDAAQEQTENGLPPPANNPPSTHTEFHQAIGTTVTDSWHYALASVWTFAIREAKELLRDKIRLFFAMFGPVIMLAAIGWSISFDVNQLNFAVLDRDQSAESRRLTEYFSGSNYFSPQDPLRATHEIDEVMKKGQVELVIDIPPHFGRDIALQRQPEVGFYIDGTATFNASNITAYIHGLMGAYHQQIIKERGIELPTTASLVPRFMYNQDFKSVNAMVPNVLMLVLMMIPAIMTALSVVREREIGSIANLYASPASVTQYLIGKQLPYVLMGLFNFVVLSAMVVFWFGVPMKGSFWATLLGGGLLVVASTGLGLLVSSFVKSQTAAFFICSLGTMIPTVNFSGLMYPVSTMIGSAYAMGVGFPASWFQRVSIGGFTKGLGFSDLLLEYMMLAFFGLVYVALACGLLKKQEK